jgi:hypothetical protein
MKLAADHPDRQLGLVYRDDTLAAGPATHVLIIGVGAYQSPRFKRPLTTTTVSARALADWFIGDAPGFHNDDCRLGSVAVLLSEPVAAGGEPLASYAGGPVPRATFADTQKAVWAWLDRINTSKDNLAFVYVASHGESLLMRTAFLLEDFGMNKYDATAGMSEIEQFVSALGNAVPVSQLLLFDCCRTPTDMALPWTEVLGNKLIALTRQPDDHGELRRQCVIAATSLGEVAIGRTNQTTLFADALVSALNGVASDGRADGWPVRPGILADTVDQLLSLHRLPDERAQTPEGRFTGSFDITFPGEPVEVPVYISMSDPASWPQANITVAANPGASATFAAAAGEPPFRLLKFPEATEIQVKAVRDGQDIGSAKNKARPPALFLEIRKAQAETATVVAHLDSGRSLIPAAELLLRVDAPVGILAGAVASIVRIDDPQKNPKEVAVALKGQTRVPVRPGGHIITLRTPDGRIQTQDVTVGRDQVLEVRFAMPPSPHEWLEMAAATGAVPSHPSIDYAQWSQIEAARQHQQSARVDRWATRPPAWLRGSPVATTIAGHLDATLAEHPLADAQMLAIAQNDDGQLIRLGFDEQGAARFEAYDNGPRSRPLFVAVETQARRELVVIPSLGTAGSQTSGGWRPYVLIDRAALPEKSLSTVVVEDRVWAGLLGFLSARDFKASSQLLSDDLGNAAIEAMQEKLGNPLAALAGALVAVSTASPDLERRWDPWLRNIANWFPGIPDGPVILGRRLLTLARSADEVAAAKRSLLEGFSRGVPIFSLAVDWLARGLESLPGDDAVLAAGRLAARKLANRVDSAQAFTVIRVSP